MSSRSLSSRSLNSRKLAGLLMLLPIAAFAQSRNYGPPPSSAPNTIEFQDRARVTNVATRYERIVVPQEQCRYEIERVESSNASPYPRERSMAGSVVGGIAGAILGNQIGGGNGRTVATAGGAIVGAIVGDRVANNNTNPSYGGAPVERQVRRCSTNNQTEERIAGYDVTYQYQGRSYVTTMQNMPGDAIMVNVAVTPAY